MSPHRVGHLVRRGVRLLTLGGCAPVGVVVGPSAGAVTAVLADTDAPAGQLRAAAPGQSACCAEATEPSTSGAPLAERSQ